MDKELVEIDGVVIEARAAGIFRVEVAGGHCVLAHLSGKIRKHKIQIAVGDRVKLDMTPYDLTKARIRYRY